MSRRRVAACPLTTGAGGAKLHQLNDECVGDILGAMDETDQWSGTVVIFASDHGDQCGSHRLRSKGPWNYQETMRIPLYVVAPDVTTRGTTTDSLSCHLDLARTIAEFGGVDISDAATLAGEGIRAEGICASDLSRGLVTARHPLPSIRAKFSFTRDGLRADHVVGQSGAP